MSRKSLILIAVSLFALALYTAGLRNASIATFVVAVLIEFWLWFQVTRSNKTKSTSDRE